MQHVVTHQRVDEFAHPVTKFRTLFLHLLQRIGQPVRDLNVFSTQLSHQLDVVIARNTQRRPGRDHAHRQLQNLGNFWPPIHQIAKKNSFPALGRLRGVSRHAIAIGLLFDGITEVGQQIDQFVKTAMHVSNNVERPVFVLQIVPQRLALNFRGVYFFQ